MSHYTTHEALTHGVRRCTVLTDRGRSLTVRIDDTVVTVPKGCVYATAQQAVDEAMRQKRAECARALRYWGLRMQRQIEVSDE